MKNGVNRKFWNRLDAKIVIAAILAFAISCKEKDSETRQFSSVRAQDGVETGKTLDLQDGDLIFQESASRQSAMVRALTRSTWTHMGIVFRSPKGLVVFEAVSPVRRTPLQEWIRRGKGGIFAVKRLEKSGQITSPVLQKMREISESWLGRPYDLLFRWEDDKLYCSELAYKLYERSAGIRLGKLQRAEEMNLKDDQVRKAIVKRFGKTRFNPSETVVTPDSIFHDPQLVRVALSSLTNQ